MYHKPLSELEASRKVKYDAILQVAYKLVIEQGIQGLNIRQVAREANTHVPIIYQLFQGKEGLLEAINQLIHEKFSQLLLFKVDTHEHIFLKITQFGVNYINLVLHNREEFKIIFSLDYSLENLSSDTSSFSQYILILKSLVKELCEEGISIYGNSEISEDMIETLTLYAWMSVHGLAYLVMESSQLNSLFSNLEEKLIEAFSMISIYKQNFIEEHFEIATQSLEIIATIDFSVNKTK